MPWVDLVAADCTGAPVAGATVRVRVPGLPELVLMSDRTGAARVNLPDVAVVDVRLEWTAGSRLVGTDRAPAEPPDGTHTVTVAELVARTGLPPRTVRRARARQVASDRLVELADALDPPPSDPAVLGAAVALMAEVIAALVDAME